LDKYVKGLKSRGVKVVISGAGGAAALPGVIAALTPLPVIGVPINSSNSIDGWDSILSILQMPSGIPVATVALDGAKNAGLLAIRILALSNDKISAKLDEFNLEMKEKVKAKSKKITEMGMIAADLA
ncbi:MAG TPA: AIR carboxylase family protein, partial [Bacteroidetes bacterium]|nr:AIR carboxylase family protein [Bacteroidota bacterium]